MKGNNLNKKSKSNFFYSLIFLFSLFLSILFFPSDQIIKGENPLLIFWNVGQGQWVTYSRGGLCLHFDMGGEFISWKKILSECKRKKNYLFLSHSDWDHIRWMKKMKKKTNHLCLQSFPREPLNPIKEKYLSQFSFCTKEEIKETKKFVYEIDFIRSESKSSLNSLLFLMKKKENEFRKKNTKRQLFKVNDLSRIYVLLNQVLLPGDSTKKAEKIWSKWLLRSLRHQSIKWLLAPHHGSKTSSSKNLLQVLKGLKMAIISSRKKRYGHPHDQVIFRFKEKKVALLRTEIWGNIKVELF